MGHIYAHLDTQGQGKTKIIEVERGSKMGKRPIEHIQSTYTHQGHTYNIHTTPEALIDSPYTLGAQTHIIHTRGTDTHNFQRKRDPPTPTYPREFRG